MSIIITLPPVVGSSTIGVVYIHTANINRRIPDGNYLILEIYLFLKNLVYKSVNMNG